MLGKRLLPSTLSRSATHALQRLDVPAGHSQVVVRHNVIHERRVHFQRRLRDGGWRTRGLGPSGAAAATSRGTLGGQLVVLGRRHDCPDLGKLSLLPSLVSRRLCRSIRSRNFWATRLGVEPEYI